MSKLKNFRVTVYMKVPIETVVRTTSMKKAREIAAERDGPGIAAYFQEMVKEDWIWGNIYNSPGDLVNDPETEVEEDD